jgi:small subunit ribosomal protein S6
MINFSVVKLGDKLEEIKDVKGKVEWNNISTIADQISSTGATGGKV